MTKKQFGSTYSKKIAILIPCFNEEKSIKKVVEDFKKELPEALVYVYDNNSTDKTKIIAESSGAITYSETRQGKGNVVRTMLRNINADCYLLVDGDNTYSAKDARKLCKPILDEEADMVIGDRLSSSYYTENKRLFHNTGNKAVSFLINKIFKSNVKDIMSGYRAMNYGFAKSLPILSKGFEIETEIAIFAIEKNFRILEIPIAYKDRTSDNPSKLNTYTDGIRVIKTIATLFKEYKPFAFFTILSMFAYILAIILGAPVIFEYFQSGIVPRFPTLIVACFLIIIGLLLSVTGIILQVIAKKDRQHYELYFNYIQSKKS